MLNRRECSHKFARPHVPISCVLCTFYHPFVFLTAIFQVDFDDGHCPTWRNTIHGIFNVAMAAQSRLKNGPKSIEEAPILWMRPRAFNMIEHHCMINGKEVSAPLFDFALLMFHTSKVLADKKIGPYFYLSKVNAQLLIYLRIL